MVNKNVYHNPYYKDRMISFRLRAEQYHQLQDILVFHGLGKIHDGDIVSDKMRALIEVLYGKTHPKGKAPTTPIKEEPEPEPEELPPEPEKPTIPLQPSLPEHTDFGWSTRTISEGQLRCVRKHAIIPLNTCDPASCKRLYPRESEECSKQNP
jgi:hypothetical protein